MSLKIWLTGNGNMNNQGTLGEFTQVTAPTYVDGKMGKAINGGAYIMSAEQASELFNNTEFSYSCWIYVNAAEGSSSTGDTAFFGNDSSGNPGSRRYSLFTYPTVNDLHWSWKYNGTADTEGSGVGASAYGVLPSYTWSHIAVVYKYPTIKIYVNCEEVYSTDGLYMNNSTYAFQTYVLRNRPELYFNDIRIYNHTLSKKEIHEIYKSLILHYPLNNPIVDLGENVLTDSWDMSGWTVQSGWSLSTDPDEGCTVAHFERTEEDAASGNLWRRIIPPTKLIPSNYPDGIIVSFDFRCKDLALLQKLNFGDRLCALQVYNSSGARIGWHEPSTLTHADAFLPNGKSVKAVTCINNGEWMRMYYYFSKASLNTVDSSSGCTVDDVAYTTLSFQLVRAGSIDIRKIKVSPVGEFTHSPYSLNRIDTILAGSDLAAGNTTVTDCSGYGNNGSTSRNLAILSSTALGTPSPRYNSFTFFSDNDYINCGNGTWVKDSITINVWAYSSGWGKDPHLFSCTEAGGFDLFEYNSKIAIEFKTSTSDTYLYTYASIKFADLTAGWHMFSWTFDGYDSKLYIDGVLEGTTHVSDSKSTLVYSTGNNVFTYIHAEAGNNGGVNAGYHAVNMSDFRIYATALGAEDIKELYQTPFSIDKNGNAFGYNFMEV